MEFELIRGVQPRAQKILIYGQHGIGKTTLAAQFPDAVFIDTEGGTSGYDVARLPTPQNWEMLLQELQWAGTNIIGGTLVIDSIDWAENLCIDYVCRQKEIKDIEQPGYGKGYVYVKDEFKNLLKWFDWLISMAVNVVLIAHDQVTTITTPENTTGYSVYGLKLSKHAAPLIKEWADAVLYCHYKQTIVTDKNDKSKAIGGTERVIQCNHTATIDAKNRWGLPDEIQMNFEQIKQFIPNTD